MVKIQKVGVTQTQRPRLGKERPPEVEQDFRNKRGVDMTRPRRVRKVSSEQGNSSPLNYESLIDTNSGFSMLGGLWGFCQ